LVEEGDSAVAERARDIKSRDLEVGMQLAQDLRTKDGVLLIVRDSTITANNIMQIRKFEQLDGSSLEISVKILDNAA